MAHPEQSPINIKEQPKITLSGWIRDCQDAYDSYRHVLWNNSASYYEKKLDHFLEKKNTPRVQNKAIQILCDTTFLSDNRKLLDVMDKLAEFDNEKSRDAFIRLFNTDKYELCGGGSHWPSPYEEPPTVEKKVWVGCNFISGIYRTYEEPNPEYSPPWDANLRILNVLSQFALKHSDWREKIINTLESYLEAKTKNWKYNNRDYLKETLYIINVFKPESTSKFIDSVPNFESYRKIRKAMVFFNSNCKTSK